MIEATTPPGGRQARRIMARVIRAVAALALGIGLTVAIGWWWAGPNGHRARRGHARLGQEAPPAFGVQPIARMKAMISRLSPLQAPLPKPAGDDWLARFHEPGQTFAQWLGSNPRTATAQRSVLY